MHPQYSPDFLNRFWIRVEKRGPDDCWLWRGSSGTNGYGRMNYDKVSYSAHRTAYEIANGPIPSGLLILHSCDRPMCVNPAHLRLGTPSQNSADMVSRGRQASGDRSPSRIHRLHRPRGEQHHSARLTSKDVIEMRRLYAKGGTSLSQLAAHYGVNKSTISSAIRRKIWSHVD